jgi:hypothetical protein
MILTLKINVAISWKFPYLSVLLIPWYSNTATVMSVFRKMHCSDILTSQMWFWQLQLLTSGSTSDVLWDHAPACCSQSATQHGGETWNSFSMRHRVCLIRDFCTPKFWPGRNFIWNCHS